MGLRDIVNQVKQHKEISRTVKAYPGRIFWVTGKFIPSQRVQLN